MGLGSEIRDPEKTYSGSRIQESKRHRIPDPDPQHCFYHQVKILRKTSISTASKSCNKQKKLRKINIFC
jgi:hypothetical protein